LIVLPTSDGYFVASATGSHFASAAEVCGTANVPNISAAIAVPEITLRMRPAPLDAARRGVHGSPRRCSAAKFVPRNKTGERNDIMGPVVVPAGRGLINVVAR
jgi:hypothetical protein